MFNNRASSRSVTLVELVVAMTIFLVISYLVLSSTITSRTTSTVAGARIFLNSQVQLANSTITRDLMQARDSDIYYNDASCGGSPCFGFRIPVVDASGDLVLVGGNPVFGDRQTEGNYIRYILVDTNLQRQALSSDKTTILGTPRTIAQNLQAGTGFAIQDTGGTYPYTLTLTFLLTAYQGTTLPTPITLNDPITIVPRN